MAMVGRRLESIAVLVRERDCASMIVQLVGM